MSATATAVSTFDPARLGDWLRTCEADHRLCCRQPPVGSADQEPLRVSISARFDESLSSNFRLLDLEAGCITSASLDTRYVALSYVSCGWSSPSTTLRLDTSNYARLSTEGALASIRAELPATINDAIDLVRAVGEQYLWVDCLCLLHDDENDMNVGVSLTRSVFQGALFTIVGAAGADAQARLVPPSARVAAANYDQRDSDIAAALSTTVYSTRAWTLAELALSQRAVIFTGAHIFFCCCQPSNTIVGRIPGPLDSVLPSLATYIQLSEDYARRTLGRDGDALRAFRGIGQPLFAGMKTVSVEGLPGCYVNAFLLFRSVVTGGSSGARRRPAFASFSWAGWDGAIEWPFDSFGGQDGNGDDDQRDNDDYYVDYDAYDTGEKTAKERAFDVVQWLKNDTLVDWFQLEPSGNMCYLCPTRVWGQRTKLARFLERQTHAVPAAAAAAVAAVNPNLLFPLHPDANNDDNDGSNTPFNTGSSIHMGMVDWDCDAVRHRLDRCNVTARRPRFPLWAFDLVNSRGELDRLLLQTLPGVLERALRSWAASRQARLKRHQVGNNGKPVPASNTPAFRPARLSGEAERTRQDTDRRAVNARNKIEQHGGGGDDAAIPKFPPYAVLCGWAIQLRLVLGSVAAATTASAATGCRPPTRTLCSASGTVVGLLHPDNIALLPPPGSAVDLVVLAQARGPAFDACLDAGLGGSHVPGAEYNILWVLCVEWLDGIAERRAVGQVMTSALRGALAPGPAVTRILLG